MGRRQYSDVHSGQMNPSGVASAAADTEEKRAK